MSKKTKEKKGARKERLEERTTGRGASSMRGTEKEERRGEETMAVSCSTQKRHDGARRPGRASRARTGIGLEIMTRALPQSLVRGTHLAIGIGLISPPSPPPEIFDSFELPMAL